MAGQGTVAAPTIDEMVARATPGELAARTYHMSSVILPLYREWRRRQEGTAEKKRPTG